MTDMDSEMSVYTAENEMEPYIKEQGLNLLVNNMVSQMDDKNDSVTPSGQTNVNLDRSMLDLAGPHIIAKVNKIIKLMIKKGFFSSFNYRGI